MTYRPIQMRYHWFAHLPAAFRSVTISHLQPEARAEIAPPWPSLVIGIGQRSVPVVRYIKEQSGGRTTIVRLGDPMVSPSYFDLVITTPQYAVRDLDKRRPAAGHDYQSSDCAGLREARWLEFIPATAPADCDWRRDIALAAEFARHRARRNEPCLQRRIAKGALCLAVTSPRTSSRLSAAARSVLGSYAVVDGDFPRYTALLNAADEMYVTGDSVSMLSEAVTLGKPTGLIPLEPNPIGRLIRVVEVVRGKAFRIRDLSKFWNDLSGRGLIGSVEEPRCGTLDADALATACDARQCRPRRKVTGDRCADPGSRRPSSATGRDRLGEALYDRHRRPFAKRIVLREIRRKRFARMDPAAHEDRVETLPRRTQHVGQQAIADREHRARQEDRLQGGVHGDRSSRAACRTRSRGRRSARKGRQLRPRRLPASHRASRPGQG